ncbi:MAG: UDP-N-acetylmuramoyl-L-alanine--D-glutamate ligase [Kiloniellales bacterium]|nr:UDP-N-acetylmuramoyl-L-alanine--D-glutamate ligase [Kiloniellales bacterium]
MRIELPFFNALPVAVLGLGKSGIAAAKVLAESGAEGWAWDDNEDVRARAREQGIPLVDLASCNWQELTTLVLSPGIPHSHPEPHPVTELARRHKVEIIGDIELLARAQRDARYIGITGTNGKSTTTALIAHILETAGREIQVGGNIGTPVLELEPLDGSGLYVLEMSSYQLELTLSITFDVAVLLNVSPDHLERHGGFEGYLAAKRLIFHRQTKPRTAVVGVDDAVSRGVCDELRAADDQIVVPISGEGRVVGGVYAAEGVLYDETEGEPVPALDLRQIISLPGSHNWQNAAAAFAACKAAGLQPPVIAACLRSFPGLAHRQEVLTAIDGVLYVNDSKATNADAAAKALACYGQIYWIAGGLAKDGGIAGLEPFFDRIVHAFLIGAAAEDFAAVLEGKVDTTICGDLETAVARAQALATAGGREGAVVLLSPACASFDQYRNFELRGDAFRALVAALPGEHEEPESVLPALAGPPPEGPPA